MSDELQTATEPDAAESPGGGDGPAAVSSEVDRNDDSGGGQGDAARRSSFGRWLMEPQTLVGLSAVLLSVCGLFVSVYEASLTRRAQRASVWPHVEVAPSFDSGRFIVRARNSGVGPAQIRAVALRLDGEVLTNWHQLSEAAGVDSATADWDQSLLHGRVLPADTESVLFRLTVAPPQPTDTGSEAEMQGRTETERRNDRRSNPELVRQLGRWVLAGELDVEFCYCSVYDECWIGNMQEFIQRFRGRSVPVERAPVDDCRGVGVSGI